eukprot:jgi/Tetstr1/433785/TSEL_002411.t1
MTDGDELEPIHTWTNVLSKRNHCMQCIGIMARATLLAEDGEEAHRRCKRVAARHPPQLAKSRCALSIFASIVCEDWHGDLWEAYVKSLNRAAANPSFAVAIWLAQVFFMLWKDIKDGSNTIRTMRLNAQGTISFGAPPLHVKLQRQGDKTEHGYIEKITFGFTQRSITFG